MARRKEAKKEKTVGKLKAAGYVLTDKVRRRYTKGGREVSYRTAFLKATGRSLEKASAAHAGKYKATTRVAKEIRDAARLGHLSDAKLISKAQERRLGERTIKSLMRGHTFKSALRRGLSAAKSEAEHPSVERRSVFGRLLGTLHEGESGSGFRRPQRYGGLPQLDERLYLKRHHPQKYRRLFGANSRKAKLLVAMGRRSAEATYDVGETP